MSVRLNLSGVEFSKNDKKRNIILPYRMNEDLAEDIGIQIGDGCLHLGKKDFAILCSGNYSEDFLYFHNFLIPLKKRLFKNVVLNLRKHKNQNTYELKIGSKAIFTFYRKVIGLPAGYKNGIKIPELLFDKESWIKACIRGIFDTDFCLTFKRKRKPYHRYPVILTCLKSKVLVKQLEMILKQLGLKPHVEYDFPAFDKRFGKNYTKNFLYLNGKKNLEKWWTIIGSNNPRLITRFQIWKRFDFCPPRT
ncbi:MAG: hypothetical protein ACE5GI_07800, partial [Candidatus Aminicenantales bacterium]